MGTDHQSAGFISSQQTERSERQQQAINLGKTLVQELNLEPGVDTLSRWIAHYITEQIAIADSATGAEKAEAEERCFNSIMKLWQHRYSLPNERSPFKDFTPIFETLQRLNPENEDPFYIKWQHDWHNPDDQNASDLDEAKSLLRMALGIDRTARVLIESVLQMAALRVTDSNARAWLKHTSDLSPNLDVQIISELVGGLEPDDKLDYQGIDDDSRKAVTSDMKGSSKESIENRIKYLDNFVELAVILRSSFEEYLENL